MDLDQSSIENLEKPLSNSESWITEYSEQPEGYFNETNKNKDTNTTSQIVPKEIKQQVLVGIAIGIAALTLISLIFLVMHTIRRKKVNDKSYLFDQCRTDMQINNESSHFKIVPININNLKCTQASNETTSKTIDEHGNIYNLNIDESSPLQNSEHCGCAESDNYDYTTYRVSDESYYGNGGTVVHV